MALTIDAAVGDNLPGQERAEAELSAEALTEFTRFHTELSAEQQADLLAEDLRPFEMLDLDMITPPQLEALVYLRGHPADEEDAVGVEALIIEEEVGTNGNNRRRPLFAVLGATVTLAFAAFGISNLQPRSQRPAEVASAPAADTADDSLLTPERPVEEEVLANDYFLTVFDEERVGQEIEDSLSDPVDFADMLMDLLVKAAATTPEIRQQYIERLTGGEQMIPNSELEYFIEELTAAYHESGLSAWDWYVELTQPVLEGPEPVWEFAAEDFFDNYWVLAVEAIKGEARIIFVIEEMGEDEDPNVGLGGSRVVYVAADGQEQDLTAEAAIQRVVAQINAQ